MEYWDLYDENRNPLNRTHLRGEQKKAGEFSVVVEIYILNTKGEVLLTLRHPDKESYPNTWEVTGGSALSGEDSISAIKRELLEETGINAELSEIHFLDSRKGETSFHDCYYVIKDTTLSDLTLQEGETVDAKWVKIEDLPYVENLCEPIRAKAMVHMDILMRISHENSSKA